MVCPAHNALLCFIICTDTLVLVVDGKQRIFGKLTAQKKRVILGVKRSLSLCECWPSTTFRLIHGTYSSISYPRTQHNSSNLLLYRMYEVRTVVGTTTHSKTSKRLADQQTRPANNGLRSKFSLSLNGQCQ